MLKNSCLDLTPPPPGVGHPMSLKAAKQETVAAAPTQQPMNFYNPAAVQQQNFGGK